MYFVMVTLLTIICPIASIVVEATFFPGSTTISLLVGKWFVFWAVGIRLFTAGLRQSFKPEFTASILGITSEETFVVIQELGFANLAIGLVGISALFIPIWITPAAIVGGLFLGLAGIRHIFKHERNRLENFALLTDLFVFAVLLIYIVAIVANQSIA